MPVAFERVAGWLADPESIELYEAIGVAVDADDRVFIFNRSDPAIIIVDRHGELIKSWGRGEFVRPHGISFDRQGNLLLTDDMGHSVRRFTPDGQHLQTIGPAGSPSDTGV